MVYRGRNRLSAHRPTRPLHHRVPPPLLRHSLRPGLPPLHPSDYQRRAREEERDVPAASRIPPPKTNDQRQEQMGSQPFPPRARRFLLRLCDRICLDGTAIDWDQCLWLRANEERLHAGQSNLRTPLNRSSTRRVTRWERASADHPHIVLHTSRQIILPLHLLPPHHRFRT